MTPLWYSTLEDHRCVCDFTAKHACVTHSRLENRGTVDIPQEALDLKRN